MQMIYIFNMLKFVAGHGTVVQPVSINIVFRCKQASFWSLKPARARNHMPERDSRPTFIFEARFRPDSQIYRGR